MLSNQSTAMLRDCWWNLSAGALTVEKWMARKIKIKWNICTTCLVWLLPLTLKCCTQSLLQGEHQKGFSVTNTGMGELASINKKWEKVTQNLRLAGSSLVLDIIKTMLFVPQSAPLAKCANITWFMYCRNKAWVDVCQYFQLAWEEIWRLTSCFMPDYRSIIPFFPDGFTESQNFLGWDGL